MSYIWTINWKKRRIRKLRGSGLLFTNRKSREVYRNNVFEEVYNIYRKSQTIKR
jgi:hypothetical protein